MTVWTFCQCFFVRETAQELPFSFEPRDAARVSCRIKCRVLLSDLSVDKLYCSNQNVSRDIMHKDARRE